jgi:nitroreductase
MLGYLCLKILLKENNKNGSCFMCPGDFMETLEAIHSRRSIRQYTGKKVQDEDMRKILAAAMMAPSAGNAQPWHFIVVDDPALLKKIPSIHPYAAMVSQVNHAILVCGDTSLERFKGFWVQDCSAAMQNLLLAAHDSGLGAVWCGIFPDEVRVQRFRELFSIPKHVVPLGFAPIGFPAVKSDRQDRYREERVHKNRW